MRALVLGGAGFLGRHLCHRLRLAGHAVTSYGRTVPSLSAGFPMVDGEVRETVGDVRDPVGLAQAVRGMDWVFHLAGSSLPHLSNQHPHRHMIEELNGVINVLDVCAKAGIGKILFASSGGTVYGISDAPLLDENHATNPISSYGIAKLAAEKYLELYRHLHGLRCVILRIANPYGEGQNGHRGQGVIAAWLHQILCGQSVTVWGEGEQVRDFVYVGDVADAFLAAAEAADLRQCLFNIAAGEGTSLNQLLRMLTRLTGNDVPVRYRLGRRCDVLRAVLDVRRARDELSWQARTPLAAGLARTWAWMQHTLNGKNAIHEAWLQRSAA